MDTNATHSIEILLWEIKFDNDHTIMMSFLVDTSNNKLRIYWSIASTSTNVSPILFFSDYDSALEELQKRCGVAALGGHTMTKSNKYGEIRGFYDPEQNYANNSVQLHKKQTQIDSDNKSN